MPIKVAAHVLIYESTGTGTWICPKSVFLAVGRQGQGGVEKTKM